MNTKLLIFLYSFLIISIYSVRILREENPEEENKENESCEENQQQEIDFSKIDPSKIRKENMPQSQVLLPIRRIGSSNIQMGVGPCGGVTKKNANTLTTKGSSVNFIWEIIVPENSGNCTVKISKGLQDNEDFQVLKPIDGEINSDGSFACGRVKGFENKEFALPEDYECDGCTLQWKWTTSYGDIYSCSDIMINGGNLNKCMGKCLNGGSCFNGNCLCADGFSGEFCEDVEGKTSLTWLWIILLLILLGTCGYFIYKYWNTIKAKASELFNKTQIKWLKNEEKELNSFKEESKTGNKINENQLQENSN
jgi:hypothetical protein